MVWGQFYETDARVIDKRFTTVDQTPGELVHPPGLRTIHTRCSRARSRRMATRAVKFANREWIWKRSGWTASG
jgi:hypothetical protein